MDQRRQEIEEQHLGHAPWDEQQAGEFEYHLALLSPDGEIVAAWDDLVAALNALREDYPFIAKGIQMEIATWPYLGDNN